MQQPRPRYRSRTHMHDRQTPFSSSNTGSSALAHPFANHSRVTPQPASRSYPRFSVFDRSTRSWRSRNNSPVSCDRPLAIGKVLGDSLRAIYHSTPRENISKVTHTARKLAVTIRQKADQRYLGAAKMSDADSSSGDVDSNTNIAEVRKSPTIRRAVCEHAHGACTKF